MAINRFAANRIIIHAQRLNRSQQRTSGDCVDSGEIEREVQAICDLRGLGVRVEPAMSLADVGLRSLDVSELAIRVETRLGRELNLGAAVLRRLETVDDLVQYMSQAVALS